MALEDPSLHCCTQYSTVHWQWIAELQAYGTGIPADTLPHSNVCRPMVYRPMYPFLPLTSFYKKSMASARTTHYQTLTWHWKTPFPCCTSLACSSLCRPSVLHIPCIVSWYPLFSVSTFLAYTYGNWQTLCVLPYYMVHVHACSDVYTRPTVIPCTPYIPDAFTILPSRLAYYGISPPCTLPWYQLLAAGLLAWAEDTYCGFPYVTSYQVLYCCTRHISWPSDLWYLLHHLHRSYADLWYLSCIPHRLSHTHSIGRAPLQCHTLTTFYGIGRPSSPLPLSSYQQQTGSIFMVS